MEEFISLAALIPIVGSAIACAAAVLQLAQRSKAEKKFVKELSTSLEKIKISEEVGNEEMRNLFMSSLRDRAKNREYPVYLKEALHQLDKSEKVLILSALNQPSSAGRIKYYNKVFKEALKLATHAA
jgi:hypothetical protein